MDSISQVWNDSKQRNQPQLILKTSDSHQAHLEHFPLSTQLIIFASFAMRHGDRHCPSPKQARQGTKKPESVRDQSENISCSNSKVQVGWSISNSIHNSIMVVVAAKLSQLDIPTQWPIMSPGKDQTVVGEIKRKRAGSRGTCQFGGCFVCDVETLRASFYSSLLLILGTQIHMCYKTQLTGIFIGKYQASFSNVRCE